jgi:DNA-binding transcriptional LysR family regulator
MLDLHRLRLLTEFAARGSIAKTAAVLGYTPSAVSQQLAALEREAGTALLDRTARRAQLTDAGRRLAGHAERILAMVEEAETDLSARATEPAGWWRPRSRPRRSPSPPRWPAACAPTPG